MISIPIRVFATVFLTMFLCLPLASQAGQVQFASLSDGAMLNAYLDMPEGNLPHKAVVMLHGCSGLGRNGSIFSNYRAWGEHLRTNGYATLMVDSAAPRGVGSTCGPNKGRDVMMRNRPGDAYAALRFLQDQPEIDDNNIALIGWSQGGGVTLLTIVDPSIGRPDPKPARDFSAAIAFYPSACNDRLQSKPYTEVEPDHWATDIPLLVLQGEADNWTLPIPCKRFIDAAKARGEPVDIVVYPDAVHSFDTPDMPVHERAGVTAPDGKPPLIGTNEEARQAALAAVPEFLSRHLRRE